MNIVGNICDDLGMRQQYRTHLVFRYFDIYRNVIYITETQQTTQEIKTITF